MLTRLPSTGPLGQESIMSTSLLPCNQPDPDESLVELTRSLGDNIRIICRHFGIVPDGECAGTGEKGTTEVECSRDLNEALHGGSIG